MTQRRPVVILGGGMAALAAAYELSRAGRQNEYEVTVFQPGWILGGKCASTRGPHPAQPNSLRVQEHGLHVWFGFYFNAFSMMHECYAALNDPRLKFDLLFERRSSTPMMEQPPGGTDWKVWPFTFPQDPPNVRPGLTPALPSLDDVVRRALGFYSTQLDQLMTDVQSNFLFVAAPLVGVLVALADALPTMPAAGPIGPVLQGVQQFLDFASQSWPGVIDAIEALGGLPFVPEGLLDDLRRAWILADLALAVTRGVGVQFADLAMRGFGALDDRDFRAWLRANGASLASVDSAPIRALYDLCFAYRNGDSSNFAQADFAAGTALRTAVRIGMAYSGAVCYSMNTGMGEAVVAPLYKLLVQRGVHFRFFHRADRIELDATGMPVRLHFTRQATVAGGGEYQPLKDAAGLAWWPDRPDFAQLANSVALAQAWSPDKEDETVAWPGQVQDSLDLRPASGPVDVVLAMSVGSLGRVTQELSAAHPQWQEMLASTRTVSTLAAQVWLTTNLAGLAYPEAVRPAMIAAPEPLDVWADMSPVVASEAWPPGTRPASVQYLCGPMAGNFANHDLAMAAVRTHTASWLDTMARNVWTGALAANAFHPPKLVGTAATAGNLQARVAQQHLRANDKGSERYVLSVAGSIAKRLRVDAFKAHRVFLAGDWTFNGLNAGCVEAAVMSGRQAAVALHGLDPGSVPGSVDFA